MVVELISVGTEILLGNIVNTNAAYLAEQCAALGLSLYYQSVVGDNEKRLKDTIKTALKHSDIVILTGGLGPTKDDLTKEMAAKVLDRELVEDKHTKARIKDYFEKRKRVKISDNNWKQAMVPKGAIVVDNHNGTAPGLILEEKKDKETKRIILLPGPPNELKPMFEKNIRPYLQKLSGEVIYSVTVKICGMGESLVETEIADLIKEQSNPTIAPYAKLDEVHLRITAKASDEKTAKEMIKPIVQKLEKRFGDYIYSKDEDETLEEVVVKMLKKRDLTLTSVESCTGGLFSGRIINVAGASDVFKQGFVTYSNKAKHKMVGVQKASLKKYGAVSEKVAKEMARGGAITAKADASVAITGIAGPDGGTAEKPVGLVYIACYLNGKTEVSEFRFTGSREKNRNSSVAKGLIMLRKMILDSDKEVKKTKQVK